MFAVFLFLALQWVMSIWCLESCGVLALLHLMITQFWLVEDFEKQNSFSHDIFYHFYLFFFFLKKSINSCSTIFCSTPLLNFASHLWFGTKVFIVLFAADVVLVRLNDLVPAAPVCVYLLLVLLLMGLHLRPPAAYPAQLGVSRLGSARPTDTMTYIHSCRLRLLQP